MSQRQEQELIGRVIEGRFRIERKLGSGGMGAVYLAEQVNLNRQVAVKVLRPGIVDEAFSIRFRAEAMATSRLNHPNIVTVHDFGVDASGQTPFPWLVLEMLDGQTLRDAIASRGRFSVEEGVAVLMGILAGLSEAHAAGIQHRDLKPENIFLVGRSGELGASSVKILDFGIAKILDVEGAHTDTASGVVVGTPGFVAPERMEGSVGDVRSDLYAVGVIAFEIFSGRPPFSAPNAMALSIKHLTEAAPRLNGIPGVAVPQALDDLVAALMARNPANRPVDAKATTMALKALSPTHSSPPPAPSASVPTTLPTLTSPPPAGMLPTDARFAPPAQRGPAMRRRLAVAALGVAALVVVVLVGLSAVGDRNDRRRKDGQAALAALNFGAAAAAFREGCMEHQDAASCGLLASLVKSRRAEDPQRDPEFDRFGVLDLWRQGCRGGDADSCIGLGIDRQLVDIDEATMTFRAACKGGSPLGCFHSKVIEGAGVPALRIGVGAIDLSEVERAAAEQSCKAGTIAACFGLSLIEMRKARTTGTFEELVRQRSAWREWCDGGWIGACAWLGSNPEHEHDLRSGVEALGKRQGSAAAASFEKILAESPDDPDAWSLLAKARIQEGKLDEASVALLKAMRLDPETIPRVRSDPELEALRGRPEVREALE